MGSANGGIEKVLDSVMGVKNNKDVMVVKGSLSGISLRLFSKPLP